MKTGHAAGGAILFIFFLMAAFASLAILNNCTNSALVTNLTGAIPCSDGEGVGVVAVLLLVVSIVLFATGDEDEPTTQPSQVYIIPQPAPQTAPVVPPMAPPPVAMPLPPLPPPPPMVACPGCRRVYQVGQFRHCPNCGEKLD